MTYQVKEIYYTLQGEGYYAGRAGVFCRFTGCNLWSGLEKDRESAKCRFCDTEFVGADGPGGGWFETPESLAAAITNTWTHTRARDSSPGEPFVVFTGGEPLLQLGTALVTAVKNHGFIIAVETNGTLASPEGIDWITVSPKPGTDLLITRGDELKLVYPQEIDPRSVEHLDFDYFFLLPMVTGDPQETSHYQQLAVDYCMKHPKWRLTLQYHRIWGLP